ncbi:bile acid:sodium symporter family protein [Stackebrandtia nassauensis]|uniref:Bile acid:sodium symporter n=1 Tax=Stackebrandtia nassauensis (strain DSM 44728 / CIP 108903 / NRRL B-16338 / NBRC 102104 / LLR-40K-21) TaxID=446470 RepID=D3Q8G9_STANL|nr:bile acid:sodium symporter family protein [Stackebrandtia nassauensis]ADD42543.1 Bile acid:sodium symporter [Stackebrandtia nassauensis DSM 44728]
MDTVLIEVFLPIALAIIMFGLGLGLTTADFARVARYPRAAAAALGCQILLLPAACFGLVLLFELPPVLAVGMMLLAASPGGTTANLYSHLFGGDVALNITLTAINSVVAVVTLPLVTNLALTYFVADGGTLGLQFGKTLQIFAIVLVPVVLGMLVKRRSPGFAARLSRPVKIASAIILVLVIAGAIATEWANLGGYIRSVGAITVLFSVLSLTVGYWVPRLLKVERRQAIASCMEIGIHNSTLAITIALSPALLGNVEMSIPAALYGLVMFFTAAGAGFLARRGVKDEPVKAA